MKNKLLVATVFSGLTMLASVVQADATAMIGGVYTFNGKFGLTAKVLSDDQKDTFVATAGATYYPNAREKVDVDVGAGYNFSSDIVIGAGWGLFSSQPQLTAGFADIKD
ncbi:hypothetical protein [Thiomicrorhabdus heinhorstiae]|uniref:Outer membrane protein beta-barrel domain-containing protein n=1 Tax=Thiomicrorhabdus heinhorstiae TaxID=2748010 RepID=A0ABS0BT33_9GAMM|nr:hypothetical protein [Thiomicrorhabdus heinhorstiae]MBF6057015.1 hypothetical protein [Thiomicrorhabdus heinhorstiae]